MSGEPVITAARVLAALSRHIGAKNGISARLLALAVTDLAPGGDTRRAERQLRHVITALRLEGQHICGTPETGYFMAENDAELDRTCSFLYERAMTGLQQIARMKRVSLPDLRGQLKLPT